MATRKSRRQQEEEKKQQRMRLIIGVFFIGLMVLSTFAFVIVFYSSGNTQGGYDFQYEIRDDTLLVRTDAGAVPFYNFPDQRYTLPESTTSLLQEAQLVVVASDASSNESIQYAEFMRFDLSQYVEVAGARTTNTTALSQFPIVSCQEATQDVPVIILDNNATGVSVDNNCLTFGASGVDVLYVRDALLYSYFDLL